MQTRSVIENVFLGVEPGWGSIVGRRRLDARYAQLSERTGFDLPARTAVRDLGAAEQQKVEILRAIARKAKVIVMDEPTAALDIARTNRLSRRSRVSGLAAARPSSSSHISSPRCWSSPTPSRCCVRASMCGRDRPPRRHPSKLVTAMLGRKFDVVFPDQGLSQGRATGLVLSVRNLSRPPEGAGCVFRRAGGRDRRSRGLDRQRAALGGVPGDLRRQARLESGEIVLNGKPVNPRSRRARRSATGSQCCRRTARGPGPAHVEVCHREHHASAPIYHVSKLGAVIARGRERKLAGRPIERLDVRARRGRRHPGRHALRREPAEGSFREVALHLTSSADHRRAHARGRYRRQGRDL